jgi:hypothetical protein
MKILQSAFHKNVTHRIESTFSNCLITRLPSSSEIRWLDYLKKQLNEKPNNKWSYWWFVNFTTNMRNENIAVLINNGAPEVILMKILSYTSDEMKWSFGDSEIINEIIRFAIYFSKSMKWFSLLE